MDYTSDAYAKGYAQGQKAVRHGQTLWDASITLNTVVGAGLVGAGLVFASKALACTGVISLASAAVMSGCKKVCRF